MKLDDNNNIIVNENMQTNIQGIYACGDCTGGILQIAKATYEGMVKDIRLNTEDRKITLTDRNGEDTGTGIVVKDLSAMVAEDMTGKDPDGTQDGVVHLDQVVDLDKLLK